MRDLIISLIVVGSLPACFRRPLIGLLMFSVLAYMRLQDLAWGFARYQRWSYIVAMVTFAGYFASRDRKPPIFDLRIVLMIFLTLAVGAGLIGAEGEIPVDPKQYMEYCKIIGIAIFTTSLVRTREHLRVMMWVIAMSFAFYGTKNGLQGIVTLGRSQILRGPGGMIEDNNDFALAMVMSIPMLVHLATSERRAILSRGCLAMVPLAMITVILTHSRGAFLSMAVSLMILVWRSRSRIMGFSIGACLAIAGVLLVPESYVARLKTIQSYEDDGSAMGRLAAWKVAGRMIQAHPFLGVGFNRFKMNYLDYEPHPTQEQREEHGTARVAHNSYLQIWAECGTPAFLAYMTMLGLCILDIRKVRKEAKRRYHASWILSYCTMFEATLAAFMCGSMFLNRAHFDLIYHLVAIVVVFGRVARDEMADLSRYPQHSRRGVRGRLVALEPAGFGRRPRGARGFRRTELIAGSGG